VVASFFACGFSQLWHQGILRQRSWEKFCTEGELSMQIRMATEADQQFLIRDYLQHLSPDLAEAQKHVLLNLQVDRTLVAEEGGLQLGVISWAVREGIRQGLAQITGIRTILTRRRQGVGRALLAAALQDMQAYYAARDTAVRRVFLFVPDQEPVVRFLEKADFSCAARLPGHREPEAVELLYARDLSA
jgi:ribosomal protein S18 acetylase RimI-like enzyme